MARVRSLEPKTHTLFRIGGNQKSHTYFRDTTGLDILETPLLCLLIKPTQQELFNMLLDMATTKTVTEP